MPMTLDEEDLQDLIALVRAGSIRDASGQGNNVANPGFGAAGEPFIRLTEASYADGVAAPRTTILTPRQISDAVADQDNNGDGVDDATPNVFGGTNLLAYFGQYFDHGLGFIAKGQSGSASIGSPSFPITTSRSNIVAGTGVDPDGIPGNADDIPAEYINNTSPFVDQNQVYGSNDALTDLLREWKDVGGQAVRTAHMLSGDLDASGYAMMATLDDIRDNYRIKTGGGELTAEDIRNYDGTGAPLLIDFIPVFKPGPNGPVLDLDAIGSYFVGGDGRANENIVLTSIHTIWTRNHNFWVDKLMADMGGRWTQDEYFEAARLLNNAEYQKVVFSEYTNALAGGLDGIDPLGDHGFDAYNPAVDARISLEFAQAAFRLGHSMINDHVTLADAAGALRDISLTQAFLNPTYLASIGIEGVLAGQGAVLHQAIDNDVTEVLRNQLVGRPLDLAALNIFRGRDVGLPTFNEVRSQLFARTGDNDLRPYSGWDDFQSRNSLSDTLMDQLKAAYPEGFAAMDLWVGGLAERPTSGQLGSTFGYIFLEQMSRLQDGDRFYYLNLFDDSLFQTPAQLVTFSDIIMRNSGLTGLDRFIFESGGQQANDPATGKPVVSDVTPTQGEALLAAPGDLADANGLGAVGYQWQALVGTVWTDIAGATAAGFTPGVAQVGQSLRVVASFVDGASTAESRTSDPTAVVGEYFFGSGAANLRSGTAGSDRLLGNGGHDTLSGGEGDDRIEGGAGLDIMRGGAGDDRIDGGAASDVAAYSGRAGQYLFALDGGAVVVGDARTGTPDGTDRLTTVDRLDFSGTVLRLVAGTNGADAAITGSGAADIVLGFDGSDAINGNSGSDVIVGGAGDDTMNGGAGNDTFVFAAGSGSDRITGFDANAAGGQDRIDLASRGIATFAELTLVGTAGGTRVVIGADSIILASVALGSVDAGDFVFA